MYLGLAADYLSVGPIGESGNTGDLLISQKALTELGKTPVRFAPQDHVKLGNLAQEQIVEGRGMISARDGQGPGPVFLDAADEFQTSLNTHAHHRHADQIGRETEYSLNRLLSAQPLAHRIHYPYFHARHILHAAGHIGKAEGRNGGPRFSLRRWGRRNDSHC